jgi:hypothetical protein
MLERFEVGTREEQQVSIEGVCSFPQFRKQLDCEQAKDRFFAKCQLLSAYFQNIGTAQRRFVSSQFGPL